MPTIGALKAHTDSPVGMLHEYFPKIPTVPALVLHTADTGMIALTLLYFDKLRTFVP